MTLEEKLHATRAAYRTSVTPELQDMITAMFTMLEIEDVVMPDFHRLRCQAVDITSILEYNFNAGITLYAIDGSELPEKAVAQIIKDLKEVTAIS